MTQQKKRLYCLLVNYKTIQGGEMSSKLTSKYCCSRLQKELEKEPFKKKVRQSIGGIHLMDKEGDNNWLKICPYCKAKIKKLTIVIDSIPYNFIQQMEIANI
uniref:ORF50 n=1 Tax=Nitrosopumilaceae spindle-shaped virus TaxID=3065433 RepID=A0AAT9JG20_9VIRU